MSPSGNGSAWMVVVGVVAFGLCAGLGTAGALVSALDLSELQIEEPFLTPEASAPTVPEAVPERAPIQARPALTLPADVQQDPRLRVLEAAFNQGTLESREVLDLQLKVYCESGLKWACSAPQHLGEVDRDLLEEGCEVGELPEQGMVAMGPPQAVSCVVLGWLLTQRDERGLPTPGRADLQWMGVGSDLVDTTRDLKGADAFERACRMGEPRGCGELGRAYGWGVGRAHEHGEAEALFEMACQAGELRSCVWRGDAYEVKEEIELAKAEYQKACDGGVGEGCRARSAYAEDPTALLAQGCDALGDGRACIWQAHNQVDAGEAEGVLRLEGYCALPTLGLPYACDLAAGYYLNEGNPVEMDQAHAVALNRAGCAGGDPASCTHLAYRFQDGRGVGKDLSEARDYLELACTQNEAEACRELAEMRFGAEDPTSSYVSADQALAAMEKACELKDGESCNRLGIVLSKGDAGVKKDTSRVEALYRQACELDWAWGCFNEAWWSDSGEAGEAPWAAKKLKLSCEMGLGRGCEAYADRLLTGRGVAYDPQAGEEYKARACELGQEAACG